MYGVSAPSISMEKSSLLKLAVVATPEIIEKVHEMMLALFNHNPVEFLHYLPFHNRGKNMCVFPDESALKEGLWVSKIMVIVCFGLLRYNPFQLPSKEKNNQRLILCQLTGPNPRRFAKKTKEFGQENALPPR